ncbi:MAG: flagellar protein FlgN [Oscillospiraceae bacterium]|nr:flagellar protein FlgN [Oscillospiraceae bacterium]
MTDYFKLVRFFNEYNAHYEEMLNFEYKKLDMINNDKIEELSKSLSTEQALIMKANSLENKRIAILGEDKNLTFKEIIEKAPVSCKKRLEEQYAELSANVLKIKELNDLANVIITGRLKKVERKTAELDTYDGRGSLKTEHASKAAIMNKV